MRLRTEQPWECGRKRAILLGVHPSPLLDPQTEWAADWLEFLRADGNEAQLGDVWVLRESPSNPRTRSWGERPDVMDWPIVGYGFTCPLETCAAGQHSWDHAHDCPRWRGDGPCKNGGPGCWTWTGSIEGGDLTGTPSLHSPLELGGCGFHGYCTSGELVG